MKKLNYFSFFKFKKALPLLITFTIINSLWSSVLIVFINNKISGKTLPFFNDYDWLVYMFFIITSFIITFLFKGYMIKVALNFAKTITLEVINGLRLSSYESYLHLGEERIRTAMKDIDVLESLPEVFIAILNAVIMLLVTLIYMFWIYPQGAVFIILIIIILCLVFLYRNKSIEKNLEEERDLADAFMRNYNDFLHGFKKIKMSSKRSDSMFYNYMVKNRDESIRLSVKAKLGALGNDLFGEYSFYFVIGVILFVLPMIFGVNQEVISGFIVVVLFLMGPIAILISHIETLIGYKIAIERLNNLVEVTILKNKLDHINNEMNPSEINPFKKLVIKDVSYKYVDKNKSITFELKPINLEIKKGEVIFISGGNGSGKSTFINLLSGLYTPSSGKILFNGIEITKNNRGDYRDMISPIFSDNHLFSENYDNFDLLSSNNELNNLLKEMLLDNVIKLDPTKNKIYQELSSGQRKRILLVFSILESKDIFIFDEWAAEQDPEFRKYFYENIIPNLKNKGKTVIAITHDDAYYKFSDRLIKFNYGTILDN